MKSMISRLNGVSFFLLLSICGALAAPAGEEADRKIAPADTLIIDVLNEKGLSVERRVEQGGTINYPLLGIVGVAGKTTREVATDLTKRLGAHFLVDPQVSVNVKEYSSHTVTVLGEVVVKMGAIKLPGERKMDILEAINESGGFTPNANRNKIQLFRKGKKTEYKLDRLLKLDPEMKVWLEPMDVIHVPERFF
jgi:polysaccharide export outer membrane protein